jgi:predicted nuclease of predicted toxin-antitoxin system
MTSFTPLRKPVDIVADESVDGLTVERLRGAGHHVLSVAEWEPGIRDKDVLRKALEAKAILLTADKDFGELVFRQGLPHSGVVLTRLAGLSLEERAELVTQLFAEHPDELGSSFAVLDERAIRLRKRSV